jgi:hypothetical protein
VDPVVHLRECALEAPLAISAYKQGSFRFLQNEGPPPRSLMVKFFEGAALSALANLDQNRTYCRRLP